ncbi:MAG: RsmD family RNA methyltransferase [Phycisphaerales bacterium]
MPRIIGGIHRRRSLTAPPDNETSRPWPDRVKESVCNLLRGWFEEARVLELFAGVGTMGLETVSRGAGRVVMVERDRRILRILEENIRQFDEEDVCEVVTGDALAAATLARAGESFDLIFIDPPYAMMRDDQTRDRVMEQVARCAPRLADESFLVLRTPLNPDRVPHDVPGLVGPEVHAYAKDMFVLLYGPDLGSRDGTAQVDAAGPAGQAGEANGGAVADADQADGPADAGP